MKKLEKDFKGYDVYQSGEKKGTFLGGVGGFVIVDKNGIPDITFQCPIEEMCETDENGIAIEEGHGSVYGLESDMIKLGITYEYPIMDVSEGQSYMFAKDLKEPHRSQFLKEWYERNTEKTEGLENINGWGTFDIDKINKAYKFYNSIIST